MTRTNVVSLCMGVAIGLAIGYFSFQQVDSNAKREYKNGYPSNCRALIYENQWDYKITNKYTYEELLESIFRNCGETGSLWVE